MPEGSHKVRPQLPGGTGSRPVHGPAGDPAGHGGWASGPEARQGFPPGSGASVQKGAAPRGPRRGWTLRQRLALVYGGISLVVLLGAAAFTAWQASTLSARNADLALAETRRVADRVGSALAQARQGVSVLAAADPLALGVDGCNRLLNATHLAMDAIVSHLFVFDAERRIACSTLPSAIGQQSAPPVVLTAERTGRSVTGSLNNAASGLGAAIGLGHPIQRGARHAGVVTASISLPALRAVAIRQPPEVEGMRAWLLDADGSSAGLIGPDQPLPPLPEALHASFLAPLPTEAGIATEGGQLWIEARATDELSLIAAIPQSVIEAGGRADVVLPPLLLAAVLMGGMGALFWSAQRFVVIPLEAATRRLEAPDGPFPDGAAAESGAADIAALIRRLGAARATRDEAIRLRDMLLREAHHRIKNHLALVASFLRLQERQLSDHAALRALRAAQDRMVAIATTYELLHDGGGATVSLDQTLERFARALAARDGFQPQGEQGHREQGGQVQRGQGQGIVVVTDLAPLEVPADIAVKLALVVNELATNALKYAFPEGAGGTVRIVLRPTLPGPDEGPGFTLQVSDNGAGMPVSSRRGLGMTVVDTLLRGIGATIEHRPGPGTTFLITWTAPPSASGGA